MKVLHMISGGDSGGAKTHVFALLDALTTMADVKIVCLTEGVFYQEILSRNIETILVKQKNRFDLSVLRRLANLIRNEGFELLHTHGARANFIAKHLKKLIGIPIITTVHSDYLLDFDGFYRKLVYTSLNVLALRRMDYYIGVSSNFRNMLIARGFLPSKIFTVYNGMDYSIPLVYDDRAAFAARIGITYDPNCVYVGLIGRHDRVKGHDIFVRAAALAAKECNNLRFVIAGEGEGRNALVQLARELGIEDKLIFAGFIKDIYSFINFIDINTLSSRSESFPYVLLEGARMKKPTISSAVGGIPDLIADGETGLLFENENPAEFARKIVALADDADLRTRLGEALYKRATENFSNFSLAQSHIDIYKAVLRDATDKKKYDVVLSGYYGFHNSGDDALLYAILESLQKHVPFIRVLVLSAKPKETIQTYGTDSMYRFNPFTLIHTLKKSYMLVNGGGSLLQDVTSSQSLWYYLLIMKAARYCGARVYIYANGIGPLHGKNRIRAAKAADLADLITLRDIASKEELLDMGVSKPPIYVTADPALALQGVSTSHIKSVLAAEEIPTEQRFLGISVRPWQKCDKQFITKLADAIEYAVKKYHLTPLFIPMKSPSDLRVASKLQDHMHSQLYCIRQKYDVRTIMGLVANCHMLLGMRLHTLIYAAAAGVPVIGLAYDPKVTGFMDYIGQRRTIEITDINMELIKRYIDDVCENHALITKELLEQAEILRQKADENAALAAELLQK